MLIKFSYLAILVQIISVIFAKHSKYLDFDEISESDEDQSETSCKDGECALASKEKQHGRSDLAIIPTEETTTDKVVDELQQLNLLNLVKLLSLFANDEKRGETRISLNVRDIQSGFHNGGSKYHVGNIHKELNRDKRDTESELNENSTPTNEDSITVLALTSETTTDNVQTAVQEMSSTELVTQSTTENSQANNDNQSANVNVRHAEPDNFQDSNVTDIYDSIANDTTPASLNGNEKTGDYNTNNVQVTITETRNNDSNNPNNETVLQVDDNKYVPLSDSLGKDNEIANAVTVSDESNFQTQSSTIKIALTRKKFNDIQNALGDDLGVETKEAKPVANFSLNGPLESDEKNPVIVMVYNCSCGSQDHHTHANKTEHTVVGNISNNNNETVFNTRRMLTQDNPVFFRDQTKEKSEETMPENAAKEQEVNDKVSNTLLENEMLQKCNSLLSLQLKNNVNEASQSKAINQGDKETLHLSSGDSFVSDRNENIDSSVTENITTINDAAKLTPVDDVASSPQLQNNNEATISPTESNTDIVDQTVFLVNENLNAAVNSQALNSPTTNTAVEEQFISKRKRRNVSDITDTIKTRDGMYRNKRGVTDASNSKDDTQNKITQNNDKTVEANKNSKSEKKNLQKLNSYRKKHSTNNILDYIHKHYVTEPNYNAEDSRDFKNRAIKTKRDIKPRNPKYYQYENDKPNLLESDPNSKEYDGTVIGIKSINDDTLELDNHDDDYSDLVEEIRNKDVTLSKNTEDNMENDDKYLNLLSFKPLHINIYFQVLMKNLERNQQKEH